MDINKCNHSTIFRPEFQVLLESTPSLFLILEPNSNFTIVAINDAYLNVRGTNCEKILGKGLFEAFPDNADGPLDTEMRELRISLEKVIRNRITDTMTIKEYRTKGFESEKSENNIRYWKTVNIPVIEKSGNIKYIIHQLEDVTELKNLKEEKTTREAKRLEKEKNREKFLDITLNTLPVLVSYVDKFLIYKYVNNTYEKWFESSRELTIGKSVPEHLGENVFEIIKPYVEMALKGKIQKFRSRIPFQSVGERIVEVTYLPDTTPEGVQGFFAVINDITEIMHTKIEIQKNENELKKILNAVPALVGYWNSDLVNIHANNAYSEYFGKSPAEIKGHDIKFLLGPELYNNTKPFIEGVLKGDVQTFEREITLPSGSIKHTIAQYFPELSEGKVQGFYDIAHDVTDLKQSEEKFKGFLESSYDAIVLVDSKSNIVFINQQVLNWFGYSTNELIGQPFEILIPSRYEEPHITQRNEYIKNPTSKSMGRHLDLWAKRKNGTEFPVDISIAPLPTESGDLVSAVIRDVTEMKKAEEQQQFLLETNRLLSETSDYQECLQRIANILVPRLADACTVSMIEDNQLKQKAVSSIDASSSNRMLVLPTSRAIELLINHVDHEEPSLKKMIIPLQIQGRKIGSISLIMAESGRTFSNMDFVFAELVANRSALYIENARLYKKAKEAIRTREDVIEIVSHDLKNPLGSISINAQILEKIKPEGISEEAWRNFKTKIDAIKNATEKATTLIKSILDLSKIESGTLIIEKKNIDIIKLTSSVVEMLHPLIDQKGIKLEMSSEIEDLIISCDQEKISQVLANLLGNALKFTSSGGIIKISLRLKGNHLHFSIQDSGYGIATKDIPYLFDRYWQAKENHNLGTGLGLSIVKGIVEAHDGKIWVESELGQGSTFHFTIPAS